MKAFLHKVYKFLENFIYYHKKPLLLFTAMFVLGTIVMVNFLNPPCDLKILVMCSAHQVDTNLLRQKAAPYAIDVNGDGKLVISIVAVSEPDYSSAMEQDDEAYLFLMDADAIKTMTFIDIDDPPYKLDKTQLRNEMEANGNSFEGMYFIIGRLKETTDGDISLRSSAEQFLTNLGVRNIYGDVL